MSSVLGLSHLAAPTASVDSVAAAVVTAAATSNGQPDTPPPATTTATSAATGVPLMRVENGRSSSFEHEEPNNLANNQGENATMRHLSRHDTVFMQAYMFSILINI